jgi:hypothetical protein
VHLECSPDHPVRQTIYFRPWFFGDFGGLAVWRFTLWIDHAPR